MRRRHLGWWAALLLPGVLLRALTPVGFMPMVGPDHRVQLVVCESFAPMPASLSMDLSMDMPMPDTMDQAPDHEHSGGHSPNRGDHGDCPYGSSPALAALPVVSILAFVVYQSSSHTPAVSGQISYFEASPLAPAPRGPPV